MKEYQIISGSDRASLTRLLNEMARDGYEVEQMTAASDKVAGESICYILLSRIANKQ